MIALLFVALVTLAVGTMAYGLLQPRLEMDKQARERVRHFRLTSEETASRQAGRERLNEVAKRRRTIQASLQEVDSRNRLRDKFTRRLTLEARLAQGGLRISVRAFVLFGVAAGVLAALVALLAGLPFLVAAGVGLTAGAGLPRWFLAYARKRRRARFTDEFANAIDLVVRGIKSGLPLGDTLRMVAQEAPDPVGAEFARVVEAQQMGLSVPEAMERLYVSMPTPETNFFSIVVSIQSQAGGNLAEALANLSRVLRDRRRMKDKIQAMSMEAKASGAIIGALPVVVAVLVYLTSPDYIALLFNTTIGNVILGASAVWMLTGILVMRSMINFDF